MWKEKQFKLAVLCFNCAVFAPGLSLAASDDVQLPVLISPSINVIHGQPTGVAPIGARLHFWISSCQKLQLSAHSGESENGITPVTLTPAQPDCDGAKQLRQYSIYLGAEEKYRSVSLENTVIVQVTPSTFSYLGTLKPGQTRAGLVSWLQQQNEQFVSPVEVGSFLGSSDVFTIKLASYLIENDVRKILYESQIFADLQTDKQSEAR